MTMFYDHFYYSDRTTKVTSVAEILNADDGTVWYRDTGEIYKKSGDKLLKKVYFQWLQADLDALYISKEDDDTFSCTWTPTGDAAYNFGSSSYRLNAIYAVTFYGKATSAEYADVAEKYTVGKKHPYGSVLQIATDSDYQVELYNGGTLAGVISKNPAYMLNSSIDGEYVVLTGQSPVICQGTITKGQYLIAQDGGYVIGVDKADLTFEQLKNRVGVALADNSGVFVLCKM